MKLHLYGKDLLLNNERGIYVVVSFDKPCIIIIKKGQMDVLVCFENAEESKVDTRYLASKFMERAAATDVIEKFESASSSSHKKQIIQANQYPINIDLLKLLSLLFI